MENNKNRKIIFSKDEKTKIVSDYNTGLSQIKIAKKNNVSLPIITKCLKQCGVNIRNGSERCKLYTVNSNYFRDIDTEEKAYFLGLLFADGYISKDNKKLELGLSGDEELKMLSRFKESINYTGGIESRKKIKPSHKQAYRITVCDELFCQNLINKGCINNKSLILKFPNENVVPKRLLNSFVLGYLDGDGAVSFKKNGFLLVGIATSVSFANGLKSYIESEFDCYVGIYDKSGRGNPLTKDVKISGLSAIKILNKLYDGCPICLNRKKVNFENYKKDQKARLENGQGYWGLDQNMVKGLCEELGVVYSDEFRYKYSKNIRNSMLYDYIGGMSKKEIQIKYHCSHTFIDRILKENNVAIRNSNEQRYKTLKQTQNSL